MVRNTLMRGGCLGSSAAVAPNRSAAAAAAAVVRLVFEVKCAGEGERRRHLELCLQVGGAAEEAGVLTAGHDKVMLRHLSDDTVPSAARHSVAVLRGDGECDRRKREGAAHC